VFKLNLYDRKGNKLKLGDIVKVSDGRQFQFFAEVKYLKDEEVITPFHTFSFHSFEKVDCVPDDAVKSTEERYDIWYLPNPKKDIAEYVKAAENYLMDWRQCEHLLESRCYRIKMI